MIDGALWARCSLGRNRWHWVVWRSFESLYDGDEPVATGYASSPEECETSALSWAPGATMKPAGWASNHHRKTCVKRRMEKPASKSKDAVQQECLYTDHEHGDFWDGIGDWLYSVPHRIIKKTEHSVFVERDGWRGRALEYDVETYRLDRHKLEKDGKVWSRQARDRYYTKPREERTEQNRPQYLVDLDLPVRATKAQIEAQFRHLAKIHHPDCGGDAEDFKRIRAAYEQSTTAVT